MGATNVDAAGKARRPASSGRGVAAMIAVVVAVPLLVLGTRVVRGNWLSQSYSDWAAIELRTRDVGTARTPLVGPYSRYGWNHPGPLLFYALALPYRLLAERGTGLLLGTLAINAAALACIGAVLCRRGGLLAAGAGGVIVLLLVRALHAALLVNPWNPFVIVLPMLAVVLLCWAAADGDSRWALPAAIGVGSFAVQSHVAAALGVAVSIVIATVYTGIDARSAREWSRFRTSALIALAVGVACWTPPLVQQLQPEGGNLGALWRFWTKSHPIMTGWSAGARIVDAQLSLPAPWLTGHEAGNPFTGVNPSWHVPYALVMLVAALVVAAHGADRQSTRLCTLALALMLASWIAVSRIVGTPFDYLVQWVWIVGAVVWLAIVWAAMRALPLGATVRRVTALVVVAGLAALVVVLTIDASHAGFDFENYERSLARIAPAARTALRALPGPVLVKSNPDLSSAKMAAGVMVLAIHSGVDARFPVSMAYAVGPAHTVDDARAASTIVVTVKQAGNRYRHDPRYREIASYDPLTAADGTGPRIDMFLQVVAP